MLKHVYEASERETTLGMVKTYLLSIRTRDKLGFGQTYLSSMRDNTGNR
jgi:hypothetical protein